VLCCFAFAFCFVLLCYGYLSLPPRRHCTHLIAHTMSMSLSVWCSSSLSCCNFTSEDSESDFEPETPKRKKAAPKKKTTAKKPAATKKKAAPKKAPAKKPAAKKGKAAAAAAAGTSAAKTDTDMSDAKEDSSVPCTPDSSTSRRGVKRKATEKKESTTTSKRKTATKTTTKTTTNRKGSKKNSKNAPEVIKVEKDALPVMLEYLIKQNRPYSHNQLFANLHGQIPKSKVAKWLAKLAQQGDLSEFIFNKTKLYMASQSNFDELSPEEVAALDSEIESKKANVADLEAKLKNITGEAAGLEAEPTDVELEQLLTELGSELETKQDKLSKLESSMTLLDPAQLQKAKDELEKIWKAWKKRQRVTMDMADCVVGESAKKPKTLMKEIDCEFDEDHGVNIKDYAEMLS
jgi:26S proteasome regulatory subunit, ATPase 3, interacting protein